MATKPWISAQKWRLMLINNSLGKHPAIRSLGGAELQEFHVEHLILAEFFGNTMLFVYQVVTCNPRDCSRWWWTWVPCFLTIWIEWSKMEINFVIGCRVHFKLSSTVKGNYCNSMCFARRIDLICKKKYKKKRVVFLLIPSSLWNTHNVHVKFPDYFCTHMLQLLNSTT